MQTKLEHMMQLQDELNSKIHPEWREQGCDWDSAILDECAELLNQLGYKWWKNQIPNIPMAKLEVVDIWCFVLSYCIQNGRSASGFISYMPKTTSQDEIDIREVIRQSKYVASSRGQSTLLMSFYGLCCEIRMTFDELYALYIGKIALNKFRQDNGYKEGTYQKIWLGEEDNQYLYDICQDFSTEGDIYNQLEKVYAAL